MTRLAGAASIDLSTPISFRFDGRELTGFKGDTLASALIANGVRIVGRSFKYHRPRGFLTAGMEEPNGLVTVGSDARADPNSPASTIEIYDGLEARSQNCWPSPRFDLMAINRAFGSIFVAGFYYKTFMWPAAFWEKVYEPLIRRAAGLGKLSGAPDPDSYDRAHAFADLLIVGAGPAGLSAALTASCDGKRVILVECDRQLGGRLLSERSQIETEAGSTWAENVREVLEKRPNVTVLTRTALFGAYDGNTYAAVERIADELVFKRVGQPRQRYWKIVSPQAILATGATERMIAFGGNDRPGIMMASALQTYVNRFGVRPGQRAAIFTVCDSGYVVADELSAAGIEVVAIIDPRQSNREGRTSALRRISGEVVRTHGKCLRSIDVRHHDGRIERVSLDLLGVAGGWTPNIGFASHLSKKPSWSNDHQAFVQKDLPDGMQFAGAAAGEFELKYALADGVRVARSLAGQTANLAPARSLSPGFAPPHVVIGCAQKAFVDLQHDVTVSDIELADREGYRSVEHLKRYTTLGMATDQGKIGQLLGHAVLAARRETDVGAVGTIAARPPYVPVAIGALAGIHRGEHLKPTRLPPTHLWATQNGASFVNAGLWKRAQWYAKPGDVSWLDSAVREAMIVRNAVGICDVSTLGKIEVAGRGAAELLDRLYVNRMSNLAIGKCRYGVMLREDGFVFDDGTVARVAEDRFVISTTTANATAVMRNIDFAIQVTWPTLDVRACSVTENWAQLAVAGPRSRELLRKLLPGIDVSNERLPFMGVIEGRWSEGPVRVFRISFSGELAYELAVPASMGEELMRTLVGLGRELGCAPYGLEAVSILRIEKGHVAAGELNGQVTMNDLNLGRMLSNKKDFIGRAMAERAALHDPARPRLVGVKPIDPTQRITAGTHLLARGAAVTAANDQGHITSVCYSPVCGQWIGLGLLSNGPARIGEIVNAASPVRGTQVEVLVCDPVFFDPAGERVRG